ncbi:DUF4031 domain-containing protein [Isoptericola sp. S6320L]|uniref:DUF4031 domain-containing protein n=1 Tax=Isoptericola sp. S6320L TaxID=2926411 RepID=UPI001FF3EC1E|nr:DUF4031 domain-containing protein [Isoptericola sp. S6320L]MCK0117904.1 DUF4031 domain-containing protein [Isoptericola sp. S6320L]
MTVLVDPPAWPAHDRLWSHLVSDASLHELRTFARAAGIPDRAFDLDHYDVPDERYDDLVAAGATPVDGRELARRLAATPLRVPGHERRRAKRPALLARWAALWAAGTDPAAHDAGGITAVGEDVVDRWREPHRVYHGRLHLADVLDAIGPLARETGAPAREAWRAEVALWFHDAVHDGATPDDEERSAALVGGLLAPLERRRVLSAGDVAEIGRLVLVTAGHDPAPEDLAGCLVSDADLAVLGGDAGRYARYVAQVRAEYGHVPDADFRAGRGAVLDQLLTLHTGPGLFRTPAARHRWADQAERNLRAELAALR